MFEVVCAAVHLSFFQFLLLSAVGIKPIDSLACALVAFVVFTKILSNYLTKRTLFRIQSGDFRRCLQISIRLDSFLIEIVCQNHTSTGLGWKIDFDWVNI